MNAQARLGAFVLLALMLLMFATSRIGDVVWFKQETHIVETEFDDLLGLDVQSPVRMAGVKVGMVQEILLRNGRAVVRIALEPGVKLPASTRASIVGRGLVGEKNLALKARPGDTELLPDGAMIPSDSSGDINTFIAKASGITEDLRKLSSSLESSIEGGENDASLRAIIAETHQAVSQLSTLMQENRQDLRDTVKNLKEISDHMQKVLPGALQDIADAGKQLPEAVASGKAFFRQGQQSLEHVDAVLLDNRENLYRMMFELRKASENLEAFSDDLRRNPWKVMAEKPEVKASPQARQEKMEEMLLTTGQMGVEPAHH